jgi:hypothetical protein
MKKRAWGDFWRSIVAVIKVQIEKPYAVFILGAFLGFVFFTSLYGLKIVNPLFVDWLMGGGDIKQHFIGWDFFRDEGWSFPVGAIEDLAYPFGISLTYTDSIPLVGIVLKLFSGILPENFQYIGLWGLLCLMLQGGIAALIIRRWTKNVVIILLCTLVFVLAPVLLARVFVHTALGSHWVLLLAILALVERSRINTAKRQIIVWSGIIALAVLIHPYLLPMVALPFVISLILLHRRWIETLTKVIVPMLVGAVLFWAIGGLMVQEASVGGLGDYGLNLNSLYNPLGWSQFLKSIPNYSGSGETLNYLGLGVLGLVLVAGYVFLKRLASPMRLVAKIKKLQIKHLLVTLSVVGLTIMAVSPSVQFGVHIIAQLPIPDRIEQYWSVFRASARLFWVVYYLIIVGLFAYIIKTWGRKSQVSLAMFLALVAAIQFTDVWFSDQTQRRQREFAQINAADYRYKPALNTDKWSNAVKDRKHLVYLDGLSDKDFFKIVDVAMKYELTMNTGYFARAPYESIAAYQQAQVRALLDGSADLAANMYVTKDTHLVKQLRDHGLNVTELRGFYVVIDRN